MTPSIFLSAPSVLLPGQERTLRTWVGMVTALGFNARPRLQRSAYERDVWDQLQRLISESHGLIAFGFQQLSVHAGVWRQGTDDECPGAAAWTSPWLQIEGGLGLASGLPVLAVADHGVSEGIFNSSAWVHPLYGVARGMPQHIPLDWARAVRRRCRRRRPAA